MWEEQHEAAQWVAFSPSVHGILGLIPGMEKIRHGGTCLDFSTWEMEAGESEVPDNPWLPSSPRLPCTTRRRREIEVGQRAGATAQ